MNDSMRKYREGQAETGNMESQQANDNLKEEEEFLSVALELAEKVFEDRREKGEDDDGVTPMEFAQKFSDLRRVFSSFDNNISGSHDWFLTIRYAPTGRKSRSEETEMDSKKSNTAENSESKLETDTNGSMEILMDKFHELYIRDTYRSSSNHASFGEEKEKRVAEGGGVDLIEKYFKDQSNSYNFATREHPFIQSIRNGTIDFSFFKQWLGQRHIIAHKFNGFGSVLETGDNGYVMEGMLKLTFDLIWFDKEASKWDVELSSITPTDLTRWYCQFMHDIWHLEDSTTRSDWTHPAMITAFWLILSFYDRVFSYCLEEGSKTPPELIATCQRWGNDRFRNYCDSISEMVDRCLSCASEKQLDVTRNMVYYALIYENMFLYMCQGECLS